MLGAGQLQRAGTCGCNTIRVRVAALGSAASRPFGAKLYSALGDEPRAADAGAGISAAGGCYYHTIEGQ